MSDLEERIISTIEYPGNKGQITISTFKVELGDNTQEVGYTLTYEGQHFGEEINLEKQDDGSYFVSTPGISTYIVRAYEEQLTREQIHDLEDKIDFSNPTIIPSQHEEVRVKLKEKGAEDYEEVRKALKNYYDENFGCTFIPNPLKPDQYTVYSPVREAYNAAKELVRGERSGRSENGGVGYQEVSGTSPEYHDENPRNNYPQRNLIKIWETGSNLSGKSAEKILNDNYRWATERATQFRDNEGNPMPPDYDNPPITSQPHVNISEEEAKKMFDSNLSDAEWYERFGTGEEITGQNREGALKRFGRGMYQLFQDLRDPNMTDGNLFGKYFGK